MVLHYAHLCAGTGGVTIAFLRDPENGESWLVTPAPRSAPRRPRRIDPPARRPRRPCLPDSAPHGAALRPSLRGGGRGRCLPDRDRDAGADHDPLGRQHLSGGAGLSGSARRCALDPRGGDEDRLCRRLVGVFRAPAGRRQRRRVLPPRSALGRSGDRFRRHRQLHAAVGLARRLRARDAAEGWPAIYDRAYLQGNIAGGEGFDWFYASAADRSAQVRTPITDGRRGAASKPWVFRYKDLRAWWSNAHYDRPGGVESGTPTAWAPQSKPIWFTELGCPGHRPGHQPAQRLLRSEVVGELHAAFLAGLARRRDPARLSRGDLSLVGRAPANNPLSSVYGGRMVHVPECAAWTWDARPYPFFPALTDVWTDGANWRLGHWLTGRLGAVSLAALVRHLCLRAGLPEVPDRRHRPLGRGRGLRHHGAGKPARLDHHAVATSASTRWRPRA